MTETDRDEIDALAGEYVLGTLTGDERRAAEARHAADPVFRALVAAWEKRLQPLADSAGAVAPPPGTFQRILARIGEAPAAHRPGIAADRGGAGAPAAADNVIALRRSVQRWRFASAIAAAAAAVLAGIMVFDRLAVPSPQQEFVAVLTAEGAKPAFVATVDVAKGTLSIRRVTAAAPEDKSYELWAVDGSDVRSLGVVEQASLRRPIQLPASGELTLAISIEPKGGSPTGVATGPIVFTGELVPAE